MNNYNEYLGDVTPSNFIHITIVDSSLPLDRSFLGLAALVLITLWFNEHLLCTPKVHIVKAMVFPVVMYGCEIWAIKKAECWRLDAFELWCWRRLLRVPWTAGRSNQWILKEINPEIHWKDWCWSSNSLTTWCKEPTHWKRPCHWEILRAEEGGDREWDGGWHHQLNGH